MAKQSNNTKPTEEANKQESAAPKKKQKKCRDFSNLTKKHYPKWTPSIALPHSEASFHRPSVWTGRTRDLRRAKRKYSKNGYVNGKSYISTSKRSIFFG